jgi:hypothetical protein
MRRNLGTFVIAGIFGAMAYGVISVVMMAPIWIVIAAVAESVAFLPADSGDWMIAAIVFFFAWIPLMLQSEMWGNIMRENSDAALGVEDDPTVKAVATAYAILSTTATAPFDNRQPPATRELEREVRRLSWEYVKLPTRSQDFNAAAKYVNRYFALAQRDGDAYYARKWASALHEAQSHLDSIRSQTISEPKVVASES